MPRHAGSGLGEGRAQGYEVLPIFGLTADEIRDPDTVVETLLDTLCAGFVLPQTKTTILQDWVKGRRSEVDDINGAVVAAGGRFGLPTTVNEAVVEVAHRIEGHQIEPGEHNLDLLLDLVGRGPVPR